LKHTRSTLEQANIYYIGPGPSGGNEMSRRTWLDNAFWETSEKMMLNCILELEDDVGRVTRQVMKINKFDREGNENPDFFEVVNAVTEEVISKNTEERRARKKAEAEEAKQREIEHAKARKLEKLFEYKLETFEVEEIKNSKNRALKSKLRRAKSKVEVDLYAMMILAEELRKKEEEEASGEN